MEPADRARGSAGGCLRAVLYALIGFAWFFAAQNAVWWYARACHSNPMPGVILVLGPALLVDWIVMVLAVWGLRELHHRLRPRLGWWTPVVLLVVVLLVTWLYWVANIPLFVFPPGLEPTCYPDGWPAWIPVPGY